MASFLDMEQKQRRMYIARLMNLNPNDPDDWPIETIDAVITLAESAADRFAHEAVRKMMSPQS